MKSSWLMGLKEFISKNSKKPWAAFETEGPSEDGRLEFSIRWNKAFIKLLKKSGYEGTTDEETVQMFFIMTHMLPEDMMHEDNTVNPDGTPRLSSDANILKR